LVRGFPEGVRRENESQGLSEEDVRKMQDYPSQRNGESYLREQKAQATARVKNGPS